MSPGPAAGGTDMSGAETLSMRKMIGSLAFVGCVSLWLLL
uniref:Uncharacterized protein n=1 Tax=Rhizophora mucronata TaxID=61149 RepID=A0A2P2NYI6_RHIMU